MTTRPEQDRAREYLRDKGTLLSSAEIHERVAAAFSALEGLLDGVTDAQAGARPIEGEWTIQEVVDHLVETNRPSLEELRDLLADRRPAAGPIPAGLQSPDPAARPYRALVADLKAVHAEVLDVLREAPDRMTAARAPIIMVINVKGEDGREAPLHWTEEVDWKAYAVIFRLHELDHLTQAKKIFRAARASAR
jgi:hypothetical protein